ncbi:MAG: hypothetical protein WCA38_02335, partial [Candidatus Acidiferrales bacterium]
TWGVSFLPGKAELLGDTLFLFSPTFNRKSYRRLAVGCTTPEFRVEFDKVWWDFLSLSDSV